MQPLVRFASAEPCVLLFSGGVESACLAHSLMEASRPFTPLYVAVGHRWEEAEQAAARSVLAAAGAPSLEVVQSDLSRLYGEHWARTGTVPDADSEDEAVRLPGRNAFLLSVAGVLCEARGVRCILTGTLGSNPFPDASVQFFDRYGSILAASIGAPISIETPLRGLTKRDIAAQLPRRLIAMTFSCLRPAGAAQCGECNKCAERQRAFSQAAEGDPTEYRRGT